VTVRIAAPFRLREVKKDQSTVKVLVKSKPQDLILRLQIDPADAAHAQDWFSLRSSDGSYEQHRKIKDDLTPGDKCVDLLFTGLDTELKYSLEVDSRPNGGKHFLFQDVSYGELAHLSGDQPEPELQEHAMLDENPGAPAGDGEA
jgi:hypothetical protein